MLKNAPTFSDYEGVDFSGFNIELFIEQRNIFIANFKELSEDESNIIFFYSRKTDSVRKFEKAFHSHNYEKFRFVDRRGVKEFTSLHQDKNNYFVFVGGKNKDFELAVNTRSLYIVPTWLPLEDRPQKYGVHVDTAKQLYKFIQALNNQNTWYSKIKVDAITTCYSLMDARYGYYAKTSEERDMLFHFQELLKEGKSRSYYQILLYHFLAGMTNSMDFDDIELFGVIPSSNCSVNKDLYAFMTQIRCLKKKALPKRYPADISEKERNLLIRHTPKKQAHVGRTSGERAMLGGDDEFSTICINPDYKKRIDALKAKGRFNVCIFDDYMTHGNSFNSVRSMLQALGANKIICVSLGIFKNPFQKRDYTIMGSVYDETYSFQLERYESLNSYEINEQAKQEVSILYNIFNS